MYARPLEKSAIWYWAKIVRACLKQFRLLDVGPSQPPGANSVKLYVTSWQNPQGGRSFDLLEDHCVVVQIDHSTNLFEWRHWSQRWDSRTVNHSASHYTVDTSHAGRHLHFAQHLGFAPNAHSLVVAVDDTGLQSKLAQESLLCLPKWTEIDDPALCSSVGEGLTWVDFETFESELTSWSRFRVFEEGVRELVRFVLIVVTLVLLTPTTRFPVIRIPAIIHVVFAPRVNTVMMVPILPTASSGQSANCPSSSVLNANCCQCDICCGR